VYYQSLKCVKIAFGVAVRGERARERLPGAVCLLKLFYPGISSSAENRALDGIKS